MFCVKGGTWWNAQVFKATQKIVCGRKVVSSCAPVSRFPHFAPVAWQQTCKFIAWQNDRVVSVFMNSLDKQTTNAKNFRMPGAIRVWMLWGPHGRNSQFWGVEDLTLCLPHAKLLESMSVGCSHSLLPHILVACIVTQASTCQRDHLITTDRYPVANGYRQLCRRGIRCINQVLRWILVQNQPGFSGSWRKHLPALQHSFQCTRYRLAELSC